MGFRIIAVILFEVSISASEGPILLFAWAVLYSALFYTVFHYTILYYRLPSCYTILSTTPHQVDIHPSSHRGDFPLEAITKNDPRTSGGATCLPLLV